MDVEKVCENLQSNERAPKIRALKELSQYCAKKEVSSQEILETFDVAYLYLLKCYADRYESVRENAIQLVTEFLGRLPPNDFHLINIVGTLLQRMGQQETLEESEEIRLLCVQQLTGLIKQYVSTSNERSLHECYGDVAQILCKSVRDSFPEVQREACECIVLWARAADSYQFQKHSEPLAIATYPMLNHKHSKSRMAAIQALAQIALHINASGEGFSRLLTEVCPLLMDPMPLVRRECGNMGVLLLLEFKDRYSYFDRIIPLVLCCLKDSSPEVVDHIRPGWLKCGKQYYDENEAELSKQEISDLPAENYPSDVQRPAIGCRGLVQRSLRLLKLITRESTDWQENVRLHSLKLLYQFVLHAEAAMTAKFFEIYPDVAHSCRDDIAEISREAYKVADLMGRLLSYEDWIDHGLDGLEKNAREGYLKCFYYMFNATLKPVKEDILRVSELLVKTDFSQSLKKEMQTYVLKMVECLLAKSDGLADELKDKEFLEKLYRNLYIAAIKVLALKFELDKTLTREEIHQNPILSQIAERKEISLPLLHEEYFGSAWAYVDNLDVPELDQCTEPILLLCGLLTIGKFRVPYLKDLQTKILLVFDNCADESKVKVFTTISVAMLEWNETINRDLEESTNLLKEFLDVVVEPRLVWRAGANAEALRALATATLCAASQGAAKEAPQILPTYTKYFPNLLEDHSVSARHYAIKCMFNFGAIAMKEMKNIAYGVLQRLDDPSAGIRELAASAVAYLQPDFEEAKTEEDQKFFQEMWQVFIRKAFDMLLLHYEGPEERLKGAIKGTVLKLAQQYPEICKESFKATIAMSYADTALRTLEKELPFEL